MTKEIGQRAGEPAGEDVERSLSVEEDGSGGRACPPTEQEECLRELADLLEALKRVGDKMQRDHNGMTVDLFAKARSEMFELNSFQSRELYRLDREYVTGEEFLKVGFEKVVGEHTEEAEKLAASMCDVGGRWPLWWSEEFKKYDFDPTYAKAHEIADRFLNQMHAYGLMERGKYVSRYRNDENFRITDQGDMDRVEALACGAERDIMDWVCKRDGRYVALATVFRGMDPTSNEDRGRWLDGWVEFLRHRLGESFRIISTNLLAARTAFRKSQVSMPSAQEIDRVTPVLSLGQLKKLREVFQWFLKQLAAKFEIKEKYIKYLEIGDLSYSSDVLPFLKNVPQGFEALAADFLRELMGARVRIALFSDEGSLCQGLEEPDSPHYSPLRVDPLTQIDSEGEYCELVTGVREICRASCSDETFVELPRGRYERSGKDDVSIPHGTEEKKPRSMVLKRHLATLRPELETCDPFLEETALRFEGVFVYDSDVDLRQKNSETGRTEEDDLIHGARFVFSRVKSDSRDFSCTAFVDCDLQVFDGNVGDICTIHGCGGKLVCTRLEDSHLEIDGNDRELSLSGCEVVGGEIDIDNDKLKMETTFFFGARICVAPDAYESSELCMRFFACDFSEAKFADDASLLAVARVSKNCIFSASQFRKIQHGLNDTEKESAEAMSAKVLGTHIKRALQCDSATFTRFVGDYMKSDCLAGPGDVDFFDSGKAWLLPGRKRLIDHLLRHGVDSKDLGMEEWWEIIAKFGETDFFELLGISNVFLKYPLRALMGLKAETCKTEAYDYDLSEERKGECDGLNLVLRLSKKPGLYTVAPVSVVSPIPLKRTQMYPYRYQALELTLFAELHVLQLHLKHVLKQVSGLVARERGVDIA